MTIIFSTLTSKLARESDRKETQSWSSSVGGGVTKNDDELA